MTADRAEVMSDFQNESFYQNALYILLLIFVVGINVLSQTKLEMHSATKISILLFRMFSSLWLKTNNHFDLTSERMFTSFKLQVLVV